MAQAQLVSVLRHVRGLAGESTLAAASDRDLLDRFCDRRDEAAFTQILRQHGPMVIGVGRRLLGPEEAEDVFQATFLLLARKAPTIRKRESVGCWLHGVAHHLALKARAREARRRTHERRAGQMRKPATAESAWRELQEVLDQALQGLPEHHRAVLLLCYLEGKTQEEAARQLGCPLGTVRSRLARGRKALQDQLARRGLALSAVALVTALAAGNAPAAQAVRLLRPTVAAALQFATGRGAAGLVSPRAAALADRGLKTLFASKTKLIVALLLAAGLAAGAATTLAWQDAGANQAEAPREATGPDPSGERKESRDPDSDGDGLADFHEVHKYRTDPNKKDTSGKGVPDGDWQQRREYSYSVRAVLRVMPPYNLKALNDDYQDVRVRKETKEFVELKVVLYPFNSNAEAIKANPTWKKDYAGMKEYLDPGVTTNWDGAMRKDLLQALSADGIDPDRLTDKEVVEQVSRWLFKRSKFRNMFCTFYVGFSGGKPDVLPGLDEAFQRDRGDPKWTVAQQFEHELFGKQMYAHRTYGTCTSTAVYQTTVLRALGIPTRMILCIPLADSSDPAQVEMIEKGLTHHRVRHDTCLGTISGGTGFTSHTFCEVFVGGRWRRLNFTTLGQNILERNYLGLMVHVHTFNDLSEANLAATWGTRYARGQRDEVFPHSNPYRLLEVSDHFGKYADVPNPPADKELKQITIEKAYWPESKDAPAEIRALKWGKEAGSGQFFVHGEEWLENAGGYLQYKLFMRRSDAEFVLRAKGQPDVSCRISMNFLTDGSQNLRELEVIIPAADYAKMVKGVAYTLHPVNGKKGYEWKVRDGLTVTRD
jgi:RNA polymerase sigma factor (sigma-70 family)